MKLINYGYGVFTDENGNHWKEFYPTYASPCDVCGLERFTGWVHGTEFVCHGCVELEDLRKEDENG